MQSPVINLNLNVTGDVSSATRQAVREMGEDIANTTYAYLYEKRKLQ